VGNLLFIAGQTGETAAGPAGPGQFEAQVRQTFRNVETVLREAGGSLANLVTMTVFLTDMRYAQEFLRLRGEILERDFPASALIGVSHLVNPHALLEIQAIAALD
jgi:enamine deaminase RidA (YjgF/YER057c/UK114 family)